MCFLLRIIYVDPLSIFHLCLILANLLALLFEMIINESKQWYSMNADWKEWTRTVKIDCVCGKRRILGIPRTQRRFFSTITIISSSFISYHRDLYTMNRHFLLCLFIFVYSCSAWYSMKLIWMTRFSLIPSLSIDEGHMIISDIAYQLSTDDVKVFKFTFAQIDRLDQDWRPHCSSQRRLSCMSWTSTLCVDNE